MATVTGVAARSPGGVLASPEARLRIETISSESDFARLADSWDGLVRAMPRPSPFLLHSWLLEWWAHYGGEDELAVHTAFRGRRLVGAIPLCVRRRGGLRVTEFIGGSWALLADLLLAPGESASAADALAEHAHAASAEHDFVNLFGLPGSSRLAAALPRADLHVVERLEAPVLDLAAGWETVYRAKMSSKARSERRRRRRQLESLGTVEVSVARTREELEPALDDAYRVHELRWHGRRDPSGFVDATGKRFHRKALLRLAGEDVPRILTIRLDGRAIAFALYLQLSGRAYGMNMAFDPAYARFAPGWDAKLLSLEVAAGEGVERAELLGATAPHKERVTDRFDPIYQGIGLPSTLRGRAAVALLVGGIRARRRIKQSATARRLYERLPRSVRR
jgi:CelD/BcsL family acetyltransferase involved in cellulose biosynthesis